jgi:hypothetical protein
LKAKDLTPKPPFSNTPIQLEATNLPATDVASDGKTGALAGAETTRAASTRKIKLSEDEIRLEEEAFNNALIELEALGKTAEQIASERAEKEQRIRPAPRTVGQTPEQDSQGDDSRQATHLNEPVSSNAGSTNPPNNLDRDASGVPATGLRSEIPDKTVGDSDISPNVIRRLNSDSSRERSIGLSEIARLGGENAFLIISKAFDDESQDVRSAAARALFNWQQDRAASFARALRESPPERRPRIGAALASSGLAGIAIGNLAGQTREEGYEAFSLLFLMTKAGEVQPLLKAVQDHPNVEVRLTVVKLLALNGQADIIPSFRRLAVSAVLPSEVRAALIEAIYELGSQVPRQPSSVVNA